MWDKIKNCYETCTDYMPIFLAVICVIFFILLGLGLGFGLIVGFAWVLMSIYNILATTFNWPTFSIWFWVGAELIIGWIRTGKFPIRISNKKEE